MVSGNCGYVYLNEAVSLIRGILAELKKQGKTILLVSHNAEDIKVLCDEIYQMDKGRLKEQTTNT